MPSELIPDNQLVKKTTTGMTIVSKVYTGPNGPLVNLSKMLMQNMPCRI